MEPNPQQGEEGNAKGVGFLDRVGVGRIRFFEHPVMMLITTVFLAYNAGRHKWATFAAQLFMACALEAAYRAIERRE